MQIAVDFLGRRPIIVGMETTRLINTETGIEAIVEAVNDKRGAFKLTLRDTDADKAYGWVWHNDREALIKQAQRAVA